MSASSRLDFDGRLELPPVSLGYVGDGRGVVKQRLGVAPTSVLHFSMKVRRHKRLQELVGDLGETREGAKRLYEGSRTAASVPVAAFAAWLVEAYSRPGDIVIDPFAGGGTRAIMAAASDRHYVGVELRADQVEVTRERIERVRPRGMLREAPVVHSADSAEFEWSAVLGERQASLLLACPPYWVREVYSNDPADLSTAPTYEQFLDGLGSCFKSALEALEVGAFVVVVVEPIIHPTTGEYLDIPGHVEGLLRGLGCRAHDRLVHRYTTYGGRRAGIFDKTRRAVREHEEAVICRFLP